VKRGEPVRNANSEYRSEKKLTHSCPARTSSYTTIRRLLYLFAVAGSMQTLPAQPAEAPAGSATSAVSSDTWHSDQATLLAGLTGIKEKTKGSLSLSPTALVFATTEGRASIDRATMLSVTIGDERMETGGTAGRITRAVIPFGGGAAVATVTNKQISLLTIQFLDDHNALHGAVFLLPKNEAILAQQQLGSPGVRPRVDRPATFCREAPADHGKTMIVVPINTLGEPVPAEYRVLLYEQLLLRLRQKDTFISIYRDGDDSTAAACPEYSFALTISAFKKGNAALRASTGPVGFFLGTTSLTFHAVVQDRNGEKLLDKNFKVSERGDSESLNVADKIARSLAGKLRKAGEHSAEI
jgi:hypothetical protein